MQGDHHMNTGVWMLNDKDPRMQKAKTDLRRQG